MLIGFGIALKLCKQIPSLVDATAIGKNDQITVDDLDRIIRTSTNECSAKAIAAMLACNNKLQQKLAARQTELGRCTDETTRIELQKAIARLESERTANNNVIVMFKKAITAAKSVTRPNKTKKPQKRQRPASPTNVANLLFQNPSQSANKRKKKDSERTP